MPATADYLAINPFADPATSDVSYVGPYFKYDSNILALRDNVNSFDLESVRTVGSSLGSVLALNVGAGLVFWQLVAGAASTAQLTMQVAPEDYNAVTNNKHWLLLAQPALIGDAAALAVSGTLSLGTSARLVALSNGVALEIKNSAGVWFRHIAWQE